MIAPAPRKALWTRAAAPAAIATLGLLALLAAHTTYSTNSSAPYSANILAESAAKPNDPNDSAYMSCTPASAMLSVPLNVIVQEVVADVPTHSRLSNIPVDAKLDVGLVTTDITNMTIKELSVGDVDIHDCRTPRDIFHKLPRLLPDVLRVEVRDINMTLRMRYDTDGLWGLGAAHGWSSAQMTGTLNMTIDYIRANLTRVTECSANFDVGDTILETDKIGEHKLIADPIGLPIGAMLCYGPDGIPGGRLFGVELEGREGTRLEGRSAEFDGIVAMLDRAFAKILPGTRQVSEDLHVAVVRWAESVRRTREAILHGIKSGFESVEAAASGTHSPPSSPPPAVPYDGWWGIVPASDVPGVQEIGTAAAELATSMVSVNEI